MKNFFIITNPHKDKDYEVTKQMQQYIEQNGGTCTVYVSEETDGDASYRYTNPKAVPLETQCVIVLGGDGTMLQAARDLAAYDIPFIGVNFGKLGFLAEMDQQDIREQLDQLLSDQCQVENRMMLSARVMRKDTCLDTQIALNDIVVNRSGMLRLIDFNVYVNHKLLSRYTADGIIIATPTGSTAYNLSAGGPIVEPNAKLIVLTPICPHSMNTRSIVLSANDVITIEMLENRSNSLEERIVAFDGCGVIPLQPGDTIEIEKCEKVTSIVKLNRAGFLEVLQQKMSDK
jgi:NAD+ kinase